MSTFITPADYHPIMKANNLDSIIEDNPALLDEEEETAISQVKGYLYQLYDTATIFATTGTARHKYLVRCCCNIIIRNLYKRLSIPAPDDVTQDYNDTLTFLERVADSKQAIDLPIKLKDDGTNTTQFRWGSQTKRNY